MSLRPDGSVLVIAPHPDDAVIGCGGTIAKHSDAGRSITVIYVTDGEMGGQEGSPNELAEQRRKEAQDAANVLGVDCVKFHGQPDGGVTYDRDTLRYYIKQLRKERPALVYYPSIDDADHDHAVVAKLIQSALRKAYAKTFPETGIPPSVEPPNALEYEVWTPLVDPSIFESIDHVREQKKEGIQCHESQLNSIDYDDATLGLNRYRGAMSGTGRHAEAFKIRHLGRLDEHEEPK